MNIWLKYLAFSLLFTRKMAWRSHGKDNSDLVYKLKSKFLYLC